jgi:hypothetical protein
MTPTLKAALTELLKASYYAEQTRRDAWEFAVEIERLDRLGLTKTDFRWLVCMGYVQHAREVTRVEDELRRFRPTGNLSFVQRTCFVLTQPGASFAQTVLDGEAASRTRITATAPTPIAGTGDCRMRQLTPVWDNQRHQLRVGDKIVKQFKWLATNQELLLRAFQEEGWPARIDDPLPGKPGQTPKRRLHDTIKCLNRNQANRLLHFRGDGTGEGVVWEFFRLDMYGRTATGD